MTNLDSVKVIDGQYCAALVHVLDEGKSLGLSGFFVSHQLDLLNLPVSKEYII